MANAVHPLTMQITWWGFTSTTRNVAVLDSDSYLGNKASGVKRTKFTYIYIYVCVFGKKDFSHLIQRDCVCGNILVEKRD